MLTMKVGTTTSFVAVGTYSDGSMYELTDGATWISTMPGVATASNTTTGLVTAVASGTTVIEAHFQGKTGSTSLTVVP
jgi:uncharacterized protein YjdB